MRGRDPGIQKYPFWRGLKFYEQKSDHLQCWNHRTDPGHHPPAGGGQCSFFEVVAYGADSRPGLLSPGSGFVLRPPGSGIYFFQSAGNRPGRISYLGAGGLRRGEIYQRSGHCGDGGLHGSLLDPVYKEGGKEDPGPGSGSGGGVDFSGLLFAVDLFRRIPPGGQGHGKIHGLRLYGGLDPQRYPAGPGSLVQRRKHELLLRRPVLRGISHETVLYQDPGDLQPYADPGGGLCLRAAL